VAILALAIAGALLWTVVAWLGESQGLALTLAGVTGIIVSIGVAVDSNIVFYESLKEDVARGRTLRSAVDGSFASAFSTIVKADVASLIGAGVLYWLTVGPVRGFALFLGLATLLDLVAAYFFMRPATLMLVKSKRLQGNPRLFGMPRPSPVVEEGVPA
jgi:preprotein translocase subunit SecD